MSTASHTYMVAAYFQKQSDAENAIRDLEKAGFRSDQLGTSFDDFDQKDWGDVTKHSSNQLTSDEYSPNSADASTAAHNESFWDKVKDFFSGETADSDINDHTVVDRAHQDITNRSWQSSGIRIPSSYHGRLKKGGGLVMVHSGDRADEVEQILTRNHGEMERDFSSWNKDTAFGMGQGTRADITGGEVGTGVAGTTRNLRNDAERVDNLRAGALNSNPELRNDNPERRIQLISEVLRIRKERVARGEVRLRKEVRTDTQNVQVPVTHEEIVIERSPVSGERTATGRIGADKEIRVPLTDERVQVEKVPVVTEEVKVGKRTVSNTQTVSDQVRREELDVERADENVRDKGKVRDINDPKRKIA